MSTRKPATPRKPVSVVTDEFILETDIVKSKRGRVAKLDSALMELLSRMDAKDPNKRAMALRATFGEVMDKEARQKVSAIVRKHFKAVHGQNIQPTINFSPTGVCQVAFKK
jgi:hypothetical protein